MRASVYLLLVLFISIATPSFAQDNQIFNQIYPISNKPALNWMSPVIRQEHIIFEATPIVRYSFYNNIFKNLVSKKHPSIPKGQAYYLAFDPQIRMYSDSSYPVRMPSYRLLLGAQFIYKIKNRNLLAFAIESGHYSNGQDGCSFSTLYKDGSPESDSVIASITPKSNLTQMLNRRNGEFSTDLTQVFVNYRLHMLDSNSLPIRTISLKLGAIYYHNNFLFVIPFGGFEPDLIKIYGRWRLQGGIEYSRFIGTKGNKLSLSQNLEYIFGAHPWVNPIRLESTAGFFLPNGLGFFGSLIYGHDNYNIRMVDSGREISVGICWNLFPDFQLEKNKNMVKL
jgi:hypothetical protein